MAWWTVALIIAGSAAALLGLYLLLGGAIMLRAVLGRRKPCGREELASEHERYGVDINWFEGKEAERWQIVSYDGITLSALYVRNPACDGRVAIVQHGYTVSPEYVQPQGALLYDMGFDLLFPYARGHGESGGRFMTMGLSDRYDHLSWMDEIVRRKGERVRIADLGVSMGGGTVCYVTGEKCPENLKCVVSDCGFDSVYNVFYDRLGRLPFKKFLLLPLVFAIRLRLGYNIKTDTPLAAVRRNRETGNIPILFIHGTRDELVNYKMGEALYLASDPEKSAFSAVPDSLHAMSVKDRPDLYREALTAFLNRFTVI